MPTTEQNPSGAVSGACPARGDSDVDAPGPAYARRHCNGSGSEHLTPQPSAPSPHQVLQGDVGGHHRLVVQQAAPFAPDGERPRARRLYCRRIDLGEEKMDFRGTKMELERYRQKRKLGSTSSNFYFPATSNIQIEY